MLHHPTRSAPTRWAPTRSARRPMAAFAAIALVALTLACAAPARIAIESQHEDLKGHLTWAPLPVTGAASGDPEAETTRARIAQLVGRTLAARGFVRVDEDPDLWVAVGFDERRHTVSVYVPMAPYLLSSMNSDVSFLVEGVRQQERVVRDVRMVVELREAKGEDRVLWRGEMAERVEDRHDLPITQVASGLIAQLPSQVPWREGDDSHLELASD